MNTLLFVFLSLSVSGSILAIILLALRPFIKNRLSQTWQYYIWLIVILRFLLPFTPQVSVVGEMSRYVQDISNPPLVAEADPGMGVNEEYTNPQAPDVPEMSQTTVPQNAEKEMSAQFMYWHDILNNIWLVWIGVALVLFVHKVTSYRSFVRYINAGIEKITDAHIWDIYREELVAAKIKRQLPFYGNNQVISPMLVGIVRPALVIPALDVSDGELRNILRHELTHYKRLDFLYKWIVQITLCLHWFNPLVYLINKHINKSCELSCDESVIKHLDEDSRIIYGDALIASLKAQGNYSDFVVSMTMSENGNIVKERLDMILGYQKKSKLIFCISILLTAFLLCGFTFAGAYTINRNNNVQGYAPISASNIEKDVTNAPDNYGHIVKTLGGANIQNIEIDAAFCALILEPTSGNIFEASISYPNFLAPNYEKYFDLIMKQKNNNTVVISTYYDNHGFDPIAGYELVDTSDVSTLVIKIPNQRYNEIQLKLSGNQIIECGIDASTLEVISNTGNIILKTDNVFDKLNINHRVGNFDLHLQELSKNTAIDSEIGNFTLSLPSDPSNLSLTVNNEDGAVCEFPTTWNPSFTGNTVVYKHGSAQNVIYVNNKRLGIFTVNIDNIPNATNQLNYLAVADTSKSYANFSETSLAKNFNTQIIKDGNFFSLKRIDVVDKSGFAYQGLVFICNGSDSYRHIFRSELERLNSAYRNSEGKINGYLDTIRDNRLRNYGAQNFSAIEKEAVIDADGVRYDAYVIAICGSDDFEKPYKEFFDIVSEEYKAI